MKTLFDLTSQERRILQKLVVERLQGQHGFRDIPVGDEATRKRKTDQCALFGNHLDDLPVTYIDECGFVPLFLFHCVTALSQFLHLEGIFRKAGSIQRQKELRNCVEQGRAVDIGDISLAYDIACLIKQFLRELPEPIFTESLASCYLQCAHTPQAVLLLSLLLPSAHVSTLKYVCRFLKQVSDHCEQNKMSARNLALVFSPSLFPNEPIRLNSNASRPSIESTQFHNQILVLEVLISNANALGVLPDEFVLAIESSLSMSSSSSKASDDEISQSNSAASIGSAETLDNIEPKDVPAASRKRKSRGSIHGLFSEISHSLAKLRRTSFGQKENVAPKFDSDSFADTLIKEISVCVGHQSCLADENEKGSGNAPGTESMLKAARTHRGANSPQRRMSIEKFEAGAQVVRFRKSLDSRPPAQLVPHADQLTFATQENCAPKLAEMTTASASLHLKDRRSSASTWQPLVKQAAPMPMPMPTVRVADQSRRLTFGEAVDGDSRSTPQAKRVLVLASVAQNSAVLPSPELLTTPKVKPQMANVDMLISKTALCRALQASSDRKRICLTHDDRRPAVQVNLL